MVINIRWKDLTPECQEQIKPYLTEDLDEDEIIFSLEPVEVNSLLDNMEEGLSDGVPENTKPVPHE